MSKHCRVAALWLLSLASFVGCDDDPGKDTEAKDAAATDDHVEVPLDSAIADATIEPAQCANGQTRCGAECVDLQNAESHCGACGTACLVGQTCTSGACVAVCTVGMTVCAGGEDASATLCVDTGRNRDHCGACGNACGEHEECEKGSCRLACVGGTVPCNGACIDGRNDARYCGASDGCGVGGRGSAGVACPNGQVCLNAACAASCPGSQLICGQACIEPATDREHCGASADCQGAAAGSVCPAGQVCAAGACAVSCPASQIECNGICIDPETDLEYCGASHDCRGADDGERCSAGQVCSGGSCALTCAGSQVLCNGSCIQPATDRAFCGASGNCTGSRDGNVCSSGEVCSGGTCGLSCQMGLLNCDGTCVDPQHNRSYCGASADCRGAQAGSVCPAGSLCNAGTCVVSCPSAQLNCGGSCVDPRTDRTYCGASGACTGANDGEVCDSGEVCSASVCSVSCPGTEIDCGGACVDPQTDRAHCGASSDCLGMHAGAACPVGQVCAAGACAVSCPSTQINCGGTCVDPLTDRAHCGASSPCTGMNAGSACAAGQVCSAGSCAFSCPSSQIVCNGSCVNPQTDRGFCGATGNCQGTNDGTVCAAYEVCSAGVCRISCPGGELACNGSCVDPQTNRAYCGASANCQAPNAGSACMNGQVCNAGVCTVSCPGSQVNCGGVCVNPLTDRAHCGASATCTGATAGTACGNGQVCNSGTCGVSCAAGTINCNGTCISPSSDPTYCGASGTCTGGSAGTPCAAGQACVGGVCALLATRRVFVTNGLWTGATIGGLAGADAKCQAEANASNLGGTFKAWLSDGTTSAAARLTHWPAPYVRIDGVKVANNWADLTDGSLAASISKTAANGTPATGTAASMCFGSGVFTGTNADGSSNTPNHCTNWTATTSTARTGNAGSLGADWTFSCLASVCGSTGNLYCIEQ